MRLLMYAAYFLCLDSWLNMAVDSLRFSMTILMRIEKIGSCFFLDNFSMKAKGYGRKELIEEYRSYLKHGSDEPSAKIRLIPSAGQHLDTESSAS